MNDHELGRIYQEWTFWTVEFPVWYDCIIFVLFCMNNRNYPNSKTSSFQNSQGQTLPRNQRRLIPDAWKKETINTTQRYGIFIAHISPVFDYLTSFTQLAQRSSGHNPRKIRLNWLPVDNRMNFSSSSQWNCKNAESVSTLQQQKRSWLYMN